MDEPVKDEPAEDGVKAEAAEGPRQRRGLPGPWTPSQSWLAASDIAGSSLRWTTRRG